MTSVRAYDESAPEALQFKMKSLQVKEVDLSQYKGKVVLVVNVASHCGYTKQYTGLQALYEKHQGDGLVILGFPCKCNQFFGQEPGTSQEIATFCKDNYGVTFDMFEKIDVNGDKAAPLFQHLTSKAAVGDNAGAVKWNFEKFLISRDGSIQRFRSPVTPEQLEAPIAKALKQKS
jgi:glutathione peroxidase